MNKLCIGTMFLYIIYKVTNSGTEYAIQSINYSKVELCHSSVYVCTKPVQMVSGAVDIKKKQGK